MAAKKPKKPGATRPLRPQSRGSPPAASQIVTCATLAKQLGVARSTVSRAANGGPLSAAVTEDGRIDLDHPDAIDWVAEREDEDEEPRPLDPEKLSLDDLEQLTLAEITERYGHIEQYYFHVRARKEYEQAARAQTQRARIEGRLVARTTVESALALIDALHVRLLRDVSRNLATRLTKAALTREEAEKLIRDQIATQLRSAKDQVSRAIRADDIDAPLRDPTPRKARK